MPTKYLRSVLLACICSATSLLSAQLTVTLTSSNYNGFSVPCFGQKSGSITLTVTGGVPPYTYEWTNGATSKDLDGIPAGYYGVFVKDSSHGAERVEITLTEPEKLQVVTMVSSFPNGHNISCFECSNGFIQTVVTEGVAPYSFAWGDAASAAPNRYGLGPRGYAVTVTDANGCAQETKVQLSQPERSDWTMSGNAGTNPVTQFIGTTDNKDVVFKSNNTERLRLGAGGSVKIAGFTGGGILKAGGDGTLSLIPVIHTPMPLDPLPYWSTGGNYTITTNEFDEVLGTKDANPLKVITNNIERLRIDTYGKLGLGMQPPVGAVNGFRLFVQDGVATGQLGTVNATDLHLATNGTERMRLTATGRLGLGTAAPTEKFEVHHADQRGGMLLNNDLLGNAHSEIRFAAGGQGRWGLGCDLAAEGDQDFFLWDEASSQVRLYVKGNGRIGMGTTDPHGALHVQSPGPAKAIVSASNAEDAETWVSNSLFGYGLRVDNTGRGRLMYNYNAPATAISLTNSGKVGIGLDPPTSGSLYKLYVEGGIVCRDVKVTITQFQDVVFEPHYDLMPLNDLRTFLNCHGHLPTMPKGSDVEADGGMEVGDLQMRLLRTVEEQALYILQLKEEMVRMEQRLAELENR